MNGRFYLGIARLFMPPLEQALRRRRDFVGGRLPKKEEPGIPTGKLMPPDLFAGFSELLNFVSGVCLGGASCRPFDGQYCRHCA
ncbi:hypothetical protein [Mesorhizobium sp. M0802]|uniref:hypothetical protein n=1 Tax=Mesorhizobium sp. M0802 TaxID=2957001 RepID=UPI003336DEF0